MRRPSWAICLRLSTPRPSLRNRVAIYRRAEPQPPPTRSVYPDCQVVPTRLCESPSCCLIRMSREPFDSVVPDSCVGREARVCRLSDSFPMSSGSRITERPGSPEPAPAGSSISGHSRQARWVSPLLATGRGLPRRGARHQESPA